MRKLIIIFMFLLTCSVAKAQVSSILTEYHSLDEYNSVSRATIQNAYGYIPTSNGWVRIAIKIKQTESSILVVGYKAKDSISGMLTEYGNPGPWKSCSEWAESVSPYTDGRSIANNFDYKVHISGLGTVYF